MANYKRGYRHFSEFVPPDADLDQWDADLDQRDADLEQWDADLERAGASHWSSGPAVRARNPRCTTPPAL